MSLCLLKSRPVCPCSLRAIIFFVLCISPVLGDSGHSADGSLKITIHVSYTGFDALPWDSKIHVYVNEISPTPANQPKLVVEKKILTKGEQIPIRTSVSIPARKLLRNHVYAICADISILDRLKFACDKAFVFSSPNRPRTANVKLRRVP